MRRREVASVSARLAGSRKSLHPRRASRNSRNDGAIHRHHEMCGMRGKTRLGSATEGPCPTTMSDAERSVEREESSRTGGADIDRTGSMTIEIAVADMTDMVRVAVGAAEVEVVEVDLVVEPSMMTMIMAAARSSSKDEA